MNRGENNIQERWKDEKKERMKEGKGERVRLETITEEGDGNNEKKKMGK